MELQVGMRYRLRNGMITGVMTRDPFDSPRRMAFETVERVDGFYAMWDSRGQAQFFGSGSAKTNRPYDIIEEAE